MERMGGRLGVACVLVALVASASAEVPRPGRAPSRWSAGKLTASGSVPYNTVYLNRCAGGCSVTGPAVSSSINNTWDVNGPRMLSAFPFDDAAWSNVVACVRDVFEPFVIDVVETDPGTANHFEVMVGGYPTEIGLQTGLLGVAPAGCTSTYMDNALVFAFAGKFRDLVSTCNESCVNALCYVITQELGHTWTSLDHVVLPADPMTYDSYLGRRYFQNSDARCGSDCRNGISPDGLPCTGPYHRCLCSGADTQNSYATIGGLFGFGAATPPTVTVDLEPGANVVPGFAVAIEASDNSGVVTRVELVVDGVLIGSLTAPPYVFAAPATLMNGTHHVEAIAYDPQQTPGKAVVDVVIGPRCEGDTDCANLTDVCIGGRCVAGPSVDGGLGTTCTLPRDCISNLCAADGSTSYCVEACSAGQCPLDFGCRELDGDSVCWPAYDESGCGCRSTGGGAPGALLVLLALARRRRAFNP